MWIVLVCVKTEDKAIHEQSMNDEPRLKFWILGILLGGIAIQITHAWSPSPYLPSGIRVFSRTYFRYTQRENHAQDEVTDVRKKIQIEKVSSKARALDAFVFRGLQISAARFCEQEAQETRVSWSLAEAIDELMKGYNDCGDPINSFPSPHMIPKQFAAILVDEKDFDEFSRDSNGLVGIIRAQARNINATKGNDASSSLERSKQSTIMRPEAFVPYQMDQPHVYLSNLRVSDQLRRQGIGNALVRAVLEYTQSLSLTYTVLTVEEGNCEAIRLYERNGFVAENEIKDGDVTMVHTSTTARR